MQGKLNQGVWKREVINGDRMCVGEGFEGKIVNLRLQRSSVVSFMYT